MMTNQEVLDNLALAQAQVEWEYSMDIAASLDVAMKRVKDWEQLKEDIAWTKKIVSDDLNKDYATGFICALRRIEKRMAEMENK
jgi:enolase